MKCKQCNKENSVTARFCTGCGTAIVVAADKKISLNKNILISLLAVAAITIFLLVNNKSGNNITSDTGSSDLYPFTAERVLSATELNNLSAHQLRIMRNEIFARHGYIFQDSEMKNYFSKFTWYTPLYNNVTNMLSGIEKKNVELIKEQEIYLKK